MSGQPRDQLKYRWKPLESNPEVFNDYIHKLGVSSSIGVSECYGLTPDLMAFVPQPVLAVILTYPYDDAKESARSDALKDLDAPAAIPEVYYMKQLVGNACGTIALIHALANTVSDADLGTGILGDFIRRTRGKKPEEIGESLGEDKKFCDQHSSSSSQGQSDDVGENSDYHFICFVPVNDVLYELDGMHKTVCPISHGKTSPETFFEDAAKIITKNFFEGTDEGSSIAYNIMTLGPL